MSDIDVQVKEDATQKESQTPEVEAQPYIEGDHSNNIARGLTLRAAERAAAENKAQSVEPEDHATSEESSQTDKAEGTPVADDAAKDSEETVVESDEEADSESSDEDEVATSDDESDEDTEKEDEWFFISEDTQYRTAEEAKEGIRNAQLYIKELKQKAEADSERVTSLEAVNAFYQQVLDQDALRAKAVQSYLPEEFRGKSEEDFEDTEDARKFVRATIHAEERFKADLEASQKAALEEQKNQEKVAEEARKWVALNVNASFFNAKNPEQLKVANDKLKSVVTEEGDESLNARQVGQLIHEMFGEKAADIFFRGIREDLLGANTTAKPTSSQSKTAQTVAKQSSDKETPAEKLAKQAEDKKAKVVKKVKEVKVEQTPIVPPAPTEDKVVPQTPREKISSGLSKALRS